MKRVTREWVKKAEADFAAALRESRVPAHDLVCFLAQQSIEKYLKALLEEHTLPFPRTHDLLHLCNLAIPLGVKIARFRLRLRKASDFAVKFRYPGASATARQSRMAVRVLRDVRAILRKALGL